jgi:hypothetical protein
MPDPADLNPATLPIRPDVVPPDAGDLDHVPDALAALVRGLRPLVRAGEPLALSLDAGPVVLRLQVAGDGALLPRADAAGDVPPTPGPTAPAGWRLFSPLEARVVRLLLDGPGTRERIARVLDEAADGKLRYVLAELVAREVASTGADGYRLVLAGGERPAVAALLDGIQAEDGGRDAPGRPPRADRVRAVPQTQPPGRPTLDELAARAGAASAERRAGR